MSNFARFPKPADATSGAAVDPLTEKITDAIRTLLSALSAHEQERVLQKITDSIRPIATPRAGEVLGAIVRLLPRRSEWTVDEVKQLIASSSVDATTKEIYNALGYLTRKGRIRRIGYGRYFFDGALIVTSDDLGGEPARNGD